MVKDTIKTVKVAEQDATQLAKQTSEKQERMLTEAKQNVITQKEELESELLKAREKAIKEATKKNEDLMEQAMIEGKEVTLELRKQAALKQDEVFQMILTELI